MISLVVCLEIQEEFIANFAFVTFAVFIVLEIHVLGEIVKVNGDSAMRAKSFVNFQMFFLNVFFDAITRFESTCTNIARPNSRKKKFFRDCGSMTFLYVLIKGFETVIFP